MSTQILQLLIEKNPCSECRHRRLPACKCAPKKGAGGKGGGSPKTAEKAQHSNAMSLATNNMVTSSTLAQLSSGNEQSLFQTSTVPMPEIKFNFFAGSQPGTMPLLTKVGLFKLDADNRAMPHKDSRLHDYMEPRDNTPRKLAPIINFRRKR